MSLTSYKFHLFEFRFNYEAVCRLDDVLFICWKKGVEWSYLQRMIQISIVELILRSCKSEETILKKVRTAAKKTWVVSCRGCVPTYWQNTIALSGVWKKFLSQHLLSKLWWRARLEAALMTWRRLGDLEETWRLPPFQERNARPAAAALRAAAAALCFKGNHKSSQVVSEVRVDTCCRALLHRKLQKLISWERFN